MFAPATAALKNNAKGSDAEPSNVNVDHVQRLADRQATWQALSLAEKAQLLQEILHRVGQQSVDEYVQQLGKGDATMMGFNVADGSNEDVGNTTAPDEAEFEATQSAFTYAVIVQGALQKLLLAYQVAAGLVKSAPALEITKSDNNNNNNNNKQSSRTTVQTMPVLPSDKFGPFAKIQTHVWLEEGVDGTNVKPFQVQETLDANRQDGCMVVLGAGNHCFLSAVDCLHGLFVENSVVLLKHHPLRGPQHDSLLRHIFQPLLERGFFDTVLDQGIRQTQAILHHPLTSKVHLTGGKATHDAIVWGNDNNKAAEPKLQATMTSELGCVTPWIVAPHFQWTDAQLEHQVQHLQAALYNNAGANCNSPKVVLLGRDWPQAEAFVSKLQTQLADAPPPVAYYPGSRERWNAFREQYPEALELGNIDNEKHRRRPLLPNATVLPWLFIDNIEVDLTTSEGRAKASQEYAFRHEPFAPVVTIAYVHGGLDTAVTLANDYLFGSLSCTVVAPFEEERDDKLEQAIADLKYGSVAINTWSAMCYLPSGGGTWGAFPGETLDNVESGIGRINNYYFLPRIEKTVLRTPMVDAIHSLPKHENFKAATNEQLATAQFLLKPGPLALLNLIVAATLGVQLPRPAQVVGAVYGWVSAKAVSLLFWRNLKPSASASKQ